jgi:hypothetical protein
MAKNGQIPKHEIPMSRTNSWAALAFGIGTFVHSFVSFRFVFYFRLVAGCFTLRLLAADYVRKDSGKGSSN